MSSNDSRSARDVLRDNVKAHLEHRQWSERHLARQAAKYAKGVSQSSINRILNPEIGVSPTARSVEGVARALGVPVWLLYLPGAPTTAPEIRRVTELVVGYLGLDEPGQHTVERVLELEVQHRQE